MMYEYDKLTPILKIFINKGMAALTKRFLNVKFRSWLPQISCKYFSEFTKAETSRSLCNHNFQQSRNWSSGNSHEIPPVKKGQAASENEKRDFLAVFPDIVQDLTNIGTHTEISDAQKWFAKVIQYNAVGGKLNRGLAVNLSLKEIMSRDQLTADVKRKSHILGWCIELMQSHFLIVDDIMDASETRRGKPCWYRQEEIGLGAINDSLLLNAGIYKLLSLHFKNEPYYLDILELFNDVNMKTVIGQCLDMQACPIGGLPNLKKFTMDQYGSLVRHKTGYYSFYLPVALAMNMAGIRETDNARVAGITDRELHRQARTILLEMGSFFQVQDDFLDCFGNPLVTGKVGTDIGEGKCSWLAVVALQRASLSQRKVMEEHYGRDEKDSVDRVRELYKELSLPATYRAYEESTSALIKTHIQQISRGLNHNVFFKFLDKIYKRSS